MKQTPLRKYLSDKRIAAQAFASDHGLSASNVRYWARGDKEPTLASQMAIERATQGAVTPSDWLEWRLSAQSVERAA
jgi:DNA-binding transcriptional regulator YdaS (Cro superfamily)